jgi:hypothetical protein
MRFFVATLWANAETARARTGLVAAAATFAAAGFSALSAALSSSISE